MSLHHKVISTGNTTLDEVYCRDHVGSLPVDYVMLAVSDIVSIVQFTGSSRLCNPRPVEKSASHPCTVLPLPSRPEVFGMICLW